MIMIENTRIPIEYNIKYLGMLVWGDWSIRLIEKNSKKK